MKSKTIILVIVLALIILSIVLLNQTKVSPSNVLDKETVNISNSNSEIIKEKESKYPKATELLRPDAFINSDNFTISDYIGKKVILVDFWTYSCINCIRTLPYLTSWYSKYEDQGLLIIGVHTPEFDFEKNLDNVKMAVEKYGIKYPVVLDNEHQTWLAYGNQYWPREYLIDIDGFVVHDHIGEGGYDETEKIIQELLKERNERLNLSNSIDTNMTNPNASSTEFQNIQTPEIYLGYSFSRNQMGNSEGYNPGKIVDYSIPSNINQNVFYLGGSWLNNEDNVESQNNSTILLNYHAKQINLVAGADNPLNISVYINDKFIQNLTINNYELYTLYNANDYSTNKLKIVSPKGLKAFTFTFG